MASMTQMIEVISKSKPSHSGPAGSHLVARLRFTLCSCRVAPIGRAASRLMSRLRLT